MTDLSRAVELRPRSAWSRYQIGLVELARGHREAAERKFDEAIDVEQSLIEEFPRDAWRAFNVAVYLFAKGDVDGSFRQVRETLGQPVRVKDVRAALRDFREVRSLTGRDTADVDALLAARLGEHG